MAAEASHIAMEAAVAEEETEETILVAAPTEAAAEEEEIRETILSAAAAAAVVVEEEEETILAAAGEDLDRQDLIAESCPSYTPGVLPLRDDEIETFDCGICLETKVVFDRFPCGGCGHHFCIRCLVQYIEGRVAGGRVPIQCPEPGCKGGELEREACKKLVDYDVYLGWGAVLASPPTLVARGSTELAVLGQALKGRCGGCTRKLKGKHVEAAGGSGGAPAAEEEEKEVWELAALRGWRSCPKCGMLIEKTFGCSSMTCRCGCGFCYSCGAPFRPSEVPFPLREAISSDELQDFAFRDVKIVAAEALPWNKIRRDEEKIAEEYEAGRDAKREAKLRARSGQQADWRQTITNDDGATSSSPQTPEADE